jgi:PmbA protein
VPGNLNLLDKNGLIKKAEKISLLFNGRKIDEFEIYISASINNEIEVYNKSVESLSHSDTSGVGIRIFKNKKAGYAWINSFEENKIKDCIDKAVLNANAADADEFNGIPKENESRYAFNENIKNYLFSKDFHKYSVDEKINLLKDIEEASKKKDKRIIGVDSLSYSDTLYETVILNSLGLKRSLLQTSSFLFLNLIARENEDTSTGFSFAYGRDPGGFNLESIAEEAVKRSTMLLGARKIKSKSSAIILDPITASQFLSVIASAITADSVQKGKSLFKGKINEKIFDIDLNIYDDGTMENGFSSKPFDAEGANKGKTRVFEKGILKTYLYDCYTARKDNELSTGNASRASYRMPPSVGISNFYIEPGKINTDEIISKIDDGFYIIDVIGMHSGANPVSGDLSVGAKGILIKNGSMSEPVKEVTIATDILNFCKKIEHVGNDLRFFPSGGFVGSPSIVIRDIAISGN